MQKKVLYYAAIYLRLSRDDEDIDGSTKRESDSISSQRELARSFVKEQPDMELFDIYIDDGFSGSNFNRPNFKRMMADIEDGNVNCVVVKDLSRFGRDYIEAGRFIQKIFPAFSVRFIAITDHYDSLTADQSTTSLVIPVKNFVNDSYCQDISEKVKSHQRLKREKGKFIGAFAVYGYQKDSEDKNKLVVDEYAAKIVRNIFAWKLDGMSNFAIANRLNDNGIFSPLQYKKSHGQNYSTGFRTGIVPQWSAVAVKRILTNEIYTGTLVQGKTEKVNYKVSKILEKPEAEWFKVAGTHEAIISKEVYQNVQRLLKVDTRAEKGKEKAHIFSGLLFCGDCKEPMIRRVNRYKGTEKVYYICSTRNRSEGCSRHSIAEADLKEVVFQIIRSQAALLIDVNRQMQYIQTKEMEFGDVVGFDKEITRLRNEQEKYLELRAGLYEDLKIGVITQEDFKNFGEIYEQQYTETEKALTKQEEMLKKLFYNGVQSGVKLERMKETMRITALDRDTLLVFVERIEVYEGKKVLVQFCYQEEIEKMLMLSEVLSSQSEEVI
ncbi:MAG: recombinase family protein [Lachnospiraceae bacterium]|nr:recombinase family protein [Lachnospiraceae bacterium]